MPKSRTKARKPLLNQRNEPYHSLLKVCLAARSYAGFARTPWLSDRSAIIQKAGVIALLPIARITSSPEDPSQNH